MIKMAQFEHIRKLYHLEGLSIREISKLTGHHRDTIAKYVYSDATEPPKYTLTKPREHPVLGEYIPIIKEILATDQSRHRKQRHTGRRIYERLRDEYNYPGGYTTVTDYVRTVRRKPKEGFLPLAFELGAHAEVDWLEARFWLRGKETTAYLFVMKLGASGGFYVRAYPCAKQEAFFDGHRHCFEFMGGVPAEITYDNLKTAVKKILEGSRREEQDRFIALRTHYLYQANFCRPGKGNEKGGVENAGKTAVRKFFVPYPEVSSFEELNHLLQEKCRELLKQNPRWEAEKAALRPLPATAFNCVRHTTAKVNSYSMVQFETNRYSVPVKYVGTRVLIRASIARLEIVAEQTVIAVHNRLYGSKQENLILDHYLELLLIKPRALANTRVYRSHALPPVYEQYRKCLTARNPHGNREFIKILMLTRQHPRKRVMEAVELALAYNVFNYDGVLNILLQLSAETTTVMPLQPERLSHLPLVAVLAPDLGKYAALMPGVQP